MKKASHLLVLFFLMSFLVNACKPVDPDLPVSHSEPIKKSTSVPTEIIDIAPTAIPQDKLEPIPTLEPIIVDPSQLRNVEIKVKHPWFGDKAKLFDQIVESFNESNIWGIEVIPVSGKGWVEIGEQLALNPLEEDLVIAQTYDIVSSAEHQNFVELSAYMFDPDYGIEDLYHRNSPFAEFSPAMQRDTEWIALPIAYQPGLIFYNQSWGLDLGFERPPLRFDDFMEQMEAGLTANLSDETLDNNGTGGLFISKSVLSAQAWYASFGGFFQAGQKNLGIDSDSLLRSYQWLKNLYNMDRSWVGVESTPYDYFSKRFALAYEGDLDDVIKQKAAMTQSAYGDSWLSMPYPTEDGSGAVPLESVSAAIKTKTDTISISAWLFLRYLLEESQQQAMTWVHGYWPVIGDPQSIAPDYAETYEPWASAVSAQVHFYLAPEEKNWDITRQIFRDAYLRIYGLDAQYFPNILDLLNQTLGEVDGGDHE